MKRQVLFVVRDAPWIGAVVPKRHAKRAVTRNGIRRQIYAVSAAFEERLPAAAHVVRLRMDFARKDFPSAWSEPLKASVRGELLRLFSQEAREDGRQGQEQRAHDKGSTDRLLGNQVADTVRADV